MKKLLLFIIIISICLSIFTLNFTVLHTNDHHGRPLPYSIDNFFYGGLPARKALIDSIKFNNPNTIILDSGDINDGLIESDFFSAEPDIIAYNKIGYNAVTLGNHEFYSSLSNLKNQMKQAAFPFLCSNILYKDSSYVAKSYIIKNIENVRIAIIGVTTNSTQFSAPSSVRKDLIFIDETKAVNDVIKSLKGKADIFIALTHLGIYEDEQSGSVKLAKSCPDLDLIIDGHSHTYLEKPLWIRQNDGDSIAIVQTECWGKFLGKIDISYEDNKLTLSSWQLFPINFQNTIKEDKELNLILNRYKSQVDTLLGAKIAVSDYFYQINDIRLKPCPIGTEIAKSMLWQYRKEKPFLAMTNGGGIRTPLNKGIILKKDIYNLLPFENNLILMEVDGKTLKEIILFNQKKIGTGGYLHFSSNISISNQEVEVDNHRIRDERNYKIVTNSYLSNGGDAFDMFLKGRTISGTDEFQREIFTNYIINQLKSKIAF